ncbi:MAG: lytic murein transglycosylase [Corynebacterium sp.]|nr:lytic murein transglycosylase [Corynebacterium sp.]
MLSGTTPMRQLAPIPDDVPPAQAAEVPNIDLDAGGRVSTQLADWAAELSADTGISQQALQAYGLAELMAARLWPTCHLSWGTLAGIGWVETRHGTYSGSAFDARSIDEEGYVLPAIIGVPLDGSAGVAEIPDTDNGELDNDTEYDRAVGPLQFIPESWKRLGMDGNGDGKNDPNQIDDAALTAAHLLCAGGDEVRDLTTSEGWTQAVHSYNMSNQYLIDVRNAAANYALRQPAGAS